MIVGIPREIKPDEYRVAIVPAGVHRLVGLGHTVLIERGAGVGSGIADDAFEAAGARIVADRLELYGRAEMVLKVKEPLADEVPLIRAGQVLFTYFHFAASRELTEAMLARGCICIAYETIERADGSLPLLIPMSEVAGRMSIQEGAKYLEKPMEGRGTLLGGVPGVAPAHVAIVGGGIVGSNAARVAAGLGAQVTILDINVDRLRALADVMPANVVTLYSDAYNIRETIGRADLVVGAILIHGSKTPKLISREDLRRMKPGAVLVDVAIDQGGMAETSRPTTHQRPTYIEERIVHYCVTNIPGAVGTTSTYALTNVTLPYAAAIATRGWRDAAAADPAIQRGVNIAQGRVTYAGVAEAWGLPLVSVRGLP
jgi:alanine dehydrogenase